MAGKMQQLKGKANEAVGRKKANFGLDTGRGETEAKGAGKMIKGKAQQAAGKARSAVKKKSR
jgi:uncharacterized protein YjbJ (UPF0337 family)